jgi:hypothetical protein
MAWVIATVLSFLSLCIVFVSFLFILHKKSSLLSASGSTPASAPSQKPALPVSKTPINLSMFDEICKKEGVEGKIDFQPLSEEENAEIKELFRKQKSLPSKMLKLHPPLKIAYTDVRNEETVRDIIPYRIIGSIDVDESDGTKEYNFFIEAYCLLRNQERSFHNNGISGAWYQGRESNLGDYLINLYRQCKSP